MSLRLVPPETMVSADDLHQPLAALSAFVDLIAEQQPDAMIDAENLAALARLVHGAFIERLAISD